MSGDSDDEEVTFRAKIVIAGKTWLSIGNQSVGKTLLANRYRHPEA